MLKLFGSSDKKGESKNYQTQNSKFKKIKKRQRQERSNDLADSKIRFLNEMMYKQTSGLSVEHFKDQTKDFSDVS